MGNYNHCAGLHPVPEVGESQVGGVGVGKSLRGLAATDSWEVKKRLIKNFRTEAGSIKSQR